MRILTVTGRTEYFERPSPTLAQCYFQCSMGSYNDKGKAEDSYDRSHGTSEVKLSARVPSAMDQAPKKKIRSASKA